MGPAPAIEVRGLSHSYAERRALDGVEFSVDVGAIFGLLGPNGGGKTTLFRILSTLLPIQEGQVRILGFDLAGQPNEVRKRIGVTFQSPSIDPKLTVGENLKYQGQIYGLFGPHLRQRIDLLADKLGLKDRLAERAETLSGGLKRRVEIAKGLLHRPQVLLLDEPSTGLDPGARHDLWRYLRGLREEDGVTRACDDSPDGRSRTLRPVGDPRPRPLDRSRYASGAAVDARRRLRHRAVR